MNTVYLRICCLRKGYHYWSYHVNRSLDTSSALQVLEVLSTVVMKLRSLCGVRIYSFFIQCKTSLSQAGGWKSQQFAINNANFSNHSRSRSSNPSVSPQSISIIATTFSSSSPSLVCNIGTTISLLLAVSHAICPGNSSTSGTIWVSFFVAAVPQTPLPKVMVWHATCPWNGPRISCDGVVGSRT